MEFMWDLDNGVNKMAFSVLWKAENPYFCSPFGDFFVGEGFPKGI
jgi:hypothetical protein